MSKEAGKHYRKGLSLGQLFPMFPVDEAAESWCGAARWPDGPYCPRCGSLLVQSGVVCATMI